MKPRQRDLSKTRVYSKRHYANNRQRMIDRAAAARPAQRQAVRDAVLAYLKDHPCIDCGEADPIVLEFDHRGEKSFAIGEAVPRGFGVKRVMAEIAKCDVRCANCHRRKTYDERGFTHRGAAQKEK